MPAEPYFTPELFRFLRQLERNNSREWFEANRPRYEQQLRGPALRLVVDMSRPLATISPQLIADPRPVGGSLFRIHRDTRFSNDKRPYKTHLGLSFYHAATKSSARGEAGNAAMGRLDAPVIYLHLQPGQCFTGGGIWHPQPQTLKRIRDYMIGNPASWKAVTRAQAFLKDFQLGGEALSRPPRGYDPAHELIDDLKRKDFIASTPLGDEEIVAPHLVKRLSKHCQRLSPLLDWLCGALDLDY